MSETLNARLTGNFSATLVNDLSISTVTDVATLSLTETLAPGTGDGKADQIFSDQRTIVANGTEVLNLHSFDGELDAVGGALALTKVKMLFVQNLNGTDANALHVGAEGSSNAWTSPFNGNTSYLSVPGNSQLVLTSTGQAGYTVGTSSNYKLKIANTSGSSSVTYNIVVVGATA